MELPSFFKKKQEPILIVGAGGDAISMAPEERDPSTIFFYTALIFLLFSILIAAYFSGGLLQSREQRFKSLFEVKAQYETEEKNLSALTTLSGRMSEIEKQSGLVEKAVPDDPRQDQVVKILENIFQDLQKKYQVELPESISWVPVSENDISNEEFLDLGVTEYHLHFVGEYSAFLEFLKKLRQSARVMDVRSVQNFQYGKSVEVSADLSFWSYHLLPV